MQEYNRKDDWKILTNVKAELVRRWVDVSKVRLNCTKGSVEIEGNLEFTGQGKTAMDSVMTIQNGLKKIEAALLSITNVRYIKWKLQGWEKKGRFWSYQPTAQIRKINEAKGLK